LIGKKAKFELKLTNDDSVKVPIEVVSKPTEEYVKKYKIDKDKLKPGQSTDIKIELRKDIPPGAFKTALTLQEEGQPDTRITIPIIGNVVEKLTPKEETPSKVSGQSTVKPKPKTVEVKPINKPDADADANKEDSGSK
jgi:hypothetical protein